MPTSILRSLLLAVALLGAGGVFCASQSRSLARLEIYPAPEQAHADLAAALKQAPAAHKRILVDFGANWCGDCKALDIYMHDAVNHPLLESSFLLVHVNIGRMDANTDLARQYGVPLDKGVPALAVLDEHGQLLYSQKSGEFESMSRMQSSDVTRFLKRWRR